VTVILILIVGVIVDGMRIEGAAIGMYRPLIPGDSAGMVVVRVLDAIVNYPPHSRVEDGNWNMRLGAEVGMRMLTWNQMTHGQGTCLVEDDLTVTEDLG